MKWFQTLYFGDQVVQDYLDAILFLANPKEKDSAHITFRGPYSDNSPERIDASELVGTTISVLGVGTFFESSQNTVFLNCGSDILEKYWNKGDYGFNPHITLYDGCSRDFAVRLYDTVRRHRLYFSVSVGSVQVVKSIKGQRSFSLILTLKPETLTAVGGQPNLLRDYADMDDWERLMIIDKVCTRLTGVAKGRAG